MKRGVLLLAVSLLGAGWYEASAENKTNPSDQQKTKSAPRTHPNTNSPTMGVIPPAKRTLAGGNSRIHKLTPQSMDRHHLPSCVRKSVCQDRFDEECHILAAGDGKSPTVPQKHQQIWVVLQKQKCSKSCTTTCQQQEKKAWKACDKRVVLCKKQYQQKLQNCRKHAKQHCDVYCKRFRGRICFAKCQVREMQTCLSPTLQQNCPLHRKACEQQVIQERQSCRVRCCAGTYETRVCKQSYTCACDKPCIKPPCSVCPCRCVDPALCQKLHPRLAGVP